MGYRILLIGAGGREHALAWTLLASPLCDQLVVAPGNPGIEALAAPLARGHGRLSCVAVAADAVADLVALAGRDRCDLVVCGPEGPLVLGLADAMTAAGIRVFGPSARAAEIEGSKAFAKDIMAKAGVPTAAYGSFSDVDEALRFVRAQPGNVVVKADGLCAGKGVTVTDSHDEACAVIRQMLVDKQFGAASARVVVEERLMGRECSMMALVDGERYALLASAEDHKAVHDGDQGPNTGGMGAYSPSPLVDEKLAARIGESVFAPVIRQMAQVGRPFRGLLYAGLMLTPDRGPLVIEFNCRFGDPETQAVLPRLAEDLLPWLMGAADGRLPGADLRWKPGLGLCVVMAAAGYPAAVRTGDAIAGLGDDGGVTDPSVTVFHAGTKRKDGGFVTAGGRILGVTATGPDLKSARDTVYGAVENIRWAGVHYRRDIGLRGQS